MLRLPVRRAVQIHSLIQRQNCSAAMATSTVSSESFGSRRSCLLVQPGKGVACSSQPQASDAAAQILAKGGNACDAAVAAAAALAVCQPTSTGAGGDAFALFFDAKTGVVRGLNGHGASPANRDCVERLRVAARSGNVCSGAMVTVPGAVQSWIDTIGRFGSGLVGLADVLAPAISMAEDGFVVQPVCAEQWLDGEALLKRAAAVDQEATRANQKAGGAPFCMLVDDGNGSVRAPVAGELFRNPDLARTLRNIARDGRDAFYRGRVAKAIVAAVEAHGGVLSLDDLERHVSEEVEPIRASYRGKIDVWEIPPSGQGLAALQALKISEKIGSLAENGSAQHYHQLIEAMRLAFADAYRYIADPKVVTVPTAELLSDKYLEHRASGFDPSRAQADVEAGTPTQLSGTVYLCVVDRDGNACSFINSNYMGFGTGIVPLGCGFTLHNRGANFAVEDDHPNVIAPSKKPYTTIIPGMATTIPSQPGERAQLYAPFGVMGGFMQPQGHLQVITNMVDFGMDPQHALDAPRFCILDSAHYGDSAGQVVFEEGADPEIILELQRMGHHVRVEPLSGVRDRLLFGNGQVIRRAPNGVLWAGSDPRHDSLAVIG